MGRRRCVSNATATRWETWRSGHLCGRRSCRGPPCGTVCVNTMISSFRRVTNNPRIRRTKERKKERKKRRTNIRACIHIHTFVHHTCVHTFTHIHTNTHARMFNLIVTGELFYFTILFKRLEQGRAILDLQPQIIKLLRLGRFERNVWILRLDERLHQCAHVQRNSQETNTHTNSHTHTHTHIHSHTHSHTNTHSVHREKKTCLYCV
jgi:hypothetical protein